MTTSTHETGRPADKERAPASKSTPIAYDSKAIAREKLASMPAGIVDEAKSMLSDPNLIDKIICDVQLLGVAGEEDLIATIYLVGTSRLLDKPLAAIVYGPSSSGKSFLINQVGTLFPDETTVRATHMTPQCLYYMDPGSLEHRFVLAGERSHQKSSDAAEATKALREMLSEGSLNKHVTIKIGGGFETKHIHQKGPISYIESTTQSKVFDEDENRCLSLFTNERPEQTRRIIEKTAFPNDKSDKKKIIQKHLALQFLIQPTEVVIPFARRLLDTFTCDRIETRRAFSQILSMIKSSALLHQKQRNTDNQGRLIATKEDYRITHWLLAKPMAKLLGNNLSEPAQRFYCRLATWAKKPFTIHTVMQRETVSSRSVRGWLRELADVGPIAQTSPSKGRQPAIWKIVDHSKQDVVGCDVLPTVEQVFILQRAGKA